MTVNKEQAIMMFDHDLDIFMNDIRGLLAHYRIADWEAYLFFRKPDCPQSYVLKYEATAGDEFAQKLVALHAEAINENVDSPIVPIGATDLGALFEHAPDEGEPHPATQCESRGCVKLNAKGREY